MSGEHKCGYDPEKEKIITDCPEALNLLLLSAYWSILGYNIRASEGRPLIDEVGRVLVVTSSEKKLEGVHDFFSQHLGLIRGGEDVLVKPTPCPGCEPADDEAVLVAIDKAYRAIDHLCNGRSDQKEGAKAVVIGLDAVVRAGSIKLDGSPNLHHLINLSRIKDEEGNLRRHHLDQQVAKLREIYCNGPSVVEYDLAAVASVKIKNGSKKHQQVAMTGIRITIHLSKFDEETIENMYADPDVISELLGINAGLPIVDEGSPVLGKISQIEIRPLAPFLAPKANVNKGIQVGQLNRRVTNAQVDGLTLDMESLSQGEKDQVFANLRTWIINGIPPNFGALFTVDPKENGELKVV